MKNTPCSSPQARKKSGFEPYTGGKLMKIPLMARRRREKKSSFAPYTGGKLMKDTSHSSPQARKNRVLNWENGTFGPPQAQNRRFWQNPQNLTRSQNLSSDEQGGGLDSV